MNIFHVQTGEQLLGGNVGVFVFDYLSGYINGKFGYVGAQAAAISTLVKCLGGAGGLAVGGEVIDKNKDAGNLVIGFGGAPIMTILNDWYHAAYNTTPRVSGTSRAAGIKASPRARALTTIRPPNTIRARAPSAQPPAINALRAGVY